MSMSSSTMKSSSPAAGSGVAAVRKTRSDSTGSSSAESEKSVSQMCGPERFHYGNSLQTGVHATSGTGNDKMLKLKAQKALEAVFLGEEVGASSAQGRPGTAEARSRSSSVVESDDRARMECTVCGYKCVPQWLNDEAHCLKCQAVLKRRPSIHQRNTSTPSPSQSSLRPMTPPLRKRSQSVSSSPMVRPERFFYDKSTWGTFGQGHKMQATEGNGTYNLTLLSSLSSSCQQKSKSKDVVGGTDRARMECTVCGYRCVPQWLNDEAHCLKCQAVLKRRPSVHQRRASETSVMRSSQRRASTPARLSDKVSSRQLVGPERFFYDKSTYTGAHAHGGPR